ncbi:MAG: hypothetical protein HC871_03040 [Rhizobiales bacterium]|nr:hypothetical protein [Hyphomicrobiales bacterium]
MAELEALAARLEQALGAVGPTGTPKGALSAQILDVLVRVSETTGGLHDLASRRLRSLATAMAIASNDGESAALLDRPSDRSTILGGEPVSQRRVLTSVR